MAGISFTAGARVTVRMNAWTTMVDLLVAVKVIGKSPAADPVGVPDKVPVPLPFLVNVIPSGRLSQGPGTIAIMSDTFRHHRRYAARRAE